MDSKNIASTHI